MTTCFVSGTRVTAERIGKMNYVPGICFVSDLGLSFICTGNIQNSRHVSHICDIPHADTVGRVA